MGEERKYLVNDYSFSDMMEIICREYGYETSRLDLDMICSYIYEASENYKHCRSILESE